MKRRRNPGAALPEVLDLAIANLVARLDAVREFAALPEAASLAAANKRISNILKKSEGSTTGGVQVALLTEAAEKALHAQLEQVAPRVQSQLAAFLQD